MRDVWNENHAVHQTRKTLLSLHLHNRNEVPPGGFRYFQTETQLWITSPSWDELLKAIAKHRKTNTLPIGTDFESEIERQLCENCPPETCHQHESSGALTQHGAVTFEMAVLTAGMLVDWFLKKGREKVSVQHATSRAAVCVRCPKNQKIEGCTGCSSKTIREIVARIVSGSDKTPHDAALEACSVCGCALGAKVWLPIKLLVEYMGSKPLDEFPELCWYRKEGLTV